MIIPITVGLAGLAALYLFRGKGDKTVKAGETWGIAIRVTPRLPTSMVGEVATLFQAASAGSVEVEGMYASEEATSTLIQLRVKYLVDSNVHYGKTSITVGGQEYSYQVIKAVKES